MLHLPFNVYPQGVLYNANIYGFKNADEQVYSLAWIWRKRMIRLFKMSQVCWQCLLFLYTKQLWIQIYNTHIPQYEMINFIIVYSFVEAHIWILNFLICQWLRSVCKTKQKKSVEISFKWRWFEQKQFSEASEPLI